MKNGPEEKILEVYLLYLINHNDIHQLGSVDNSLGSSQLTEEKRFEFWTQKRLSLNQNARMQILKIIKK